MLSMQDKEVSGNEEIINSVEMLNEKKRKHNEHLSQSATIQQFVGELLTQKRARLKMQAESLGNGCFQDNVHQMLNGPSLMMVGQQTTLPDQSQHK